MAMLYTPDGRTKVVRPSGGKFTNEEVWAMLGGYHETLRTIDGERMLVHDEGRLKGLELNIPATRIYVHGRHDVIVGPALVLEESERF